MTWDCILILWPGKWPSTWPWPCRSLSASIGVIYGGTRGTGTPTFWTEGTGTRTPTSQDTGEEFAVIWDDLRRLNYTKTVFGRSSRLVSVTKGVKFFPSESVPPLFRPKLRPCRRACFLLWIERTVILFTGDLCMCVCVCVRSKYYDISMCVRRAWSTCVPDNANSADDIIQSWRGINASLSYLCNHAKKGTGTSQSHIVQVLIT